MNANKANPPTTAPAMTPVFETGWEDAAGVSVTLGLAALDKVLDSVVDMTELAVIELVKLLEVLKVVLGVAVELNRVRIGTVLGLDSVELFAVDTDDDDVVVTTSKIEVATPKMVCVAWNAAQEYPSYALCNCESQKSNLTQYGASEEHGRHKEPTQVSGAYIPTQVV